MKVGYLLEVRFLPFESTINIPLFYYVV
jgi:hypothetical protein